MGSSHRVMGRLTIIFLLFYFIEKSAEYDGSCEENVSEALANGANDVIVVRKSNGQLLSTGWHGQIGKFNSMFQSREGRDVSVFVNSVPARPRMTICGSGTFQFKAGPGPNTMTSEDLKELNLQPGHNEARYVCPALGEVLHFS